MTKEEGEKEEHGQKGNRNKEEEEGRIESNNSEEDVQNW
jgi:hypothetical protein